MKLLQPLKRTLALTRKEIQTIIKDRTAMVLVFMLPIITIGTLAIAIQQNDIQSETVPLNFGVINLDTTDTYPGVDLAENFTATLAELDGLTVIRYDNESAAYLALYRGELDAYIIIPDGFEHALALDLPTTVDVHTSSTEIQGQGAAIIAVTEASLLFRQRLGWIRSEILPIPVIEFVPEGDTLAIQVGAFLDRSGAERAATEAARVAADAGLGSVRIVPKTNDRGQQLHVVQFGAFATRREAISARRKLGRLDYLVAPTAAALN